MATCTTAYHESLFIAALKGRLYLWRVPQPVDLAHNMLSHAGTSCRIVMGPEAIPLVVCCFTLHHWMPQQLMSR